MEQNDLDKLRSLPIEEVAERLGLPISHHKTLCAFHNDSHPSLSFKRNHYRCFVCGASGDGIDLVRKQLGMNFLDACKWLADRSNIILTEYKPPDKEKDRAEKPFPEEFFDFVLSHSLLGPQAEEFLFKERKLSREVIRELGIGAINKSGRWFLYCMSRHFTQEQLREYGIARGGRLGESDASSGHLACSFPIVTSTDGSSASSLVSSDGTDDSPTRILRLDMMPSPSKHLGFSSRKAVILSSSTFLY